MHFILNLQGPGASAGRSSRASSVGAHSRLRSSGMRERRDLRDVDVEEDIFNAPPKSDSKSKRSVWQLRNMAESGTEEGFPPVFKEKIHDKAYHVGDSCTLRVQVLANPTPSVSWYRNDELLTDGGRVRTFKGEEGRHNLTILSTKPHDFGVFKCVARNKYGKVTCRARMLLGDNPTRPGRPHVTKVADSEIYMIWDEPETDGNSYILAYRVDWHRQGDERWTVATYCIDECALVKGLKPETKYRFRVCAINKFGISPYSWASVEVKTKPKNAPCIDIDSETKKILLRSRQATSRPSPDPSPSASRRNSLDDLPDPADLADRKEDYDFLDRDVHLQEVDPKKYLQFTTDLWRGRFTLIRNVKPKEGTKVRRVAKVIPYSDNTKEDSLREFEMLKSLRQEHIVRMYEGFLHNGFCVLILEKLYGENVARSLSLKNKYNEYQVTGIIKQVLDALQFLHHRGIVHLNLQPDNVIMVSRRRFDIKLIDFGRARKITSYDGEKVDRLGTAEFMAPEKVSRERVGVAADIWGVGVLAFIMVSGVSPFRGENDDETYANITHVRYDAHQIYHNVTKYALKFLFKTLKRSPVARLTTEEALDNRWLMLNAPTVKQRKAAIFSTDRLRLFEEDYIQRRMEGAAPSEELLKAYGASGNEGFSSDDEDLFGSNNY